MSSKKIKEVKGSANFIKQIIPFKSTHPILDQLFIKMYNKSICNANYLKFKKTQKIHSQFTKISVNVQIQSTIPWKIINQSCLNKDY